MQSSHLKMSTQSSNFSTSVGDPDGVLVQRWLTKHKSNVFDEIPWYREKLFELIKTLSMTIEVFNHGFRYRSLKHIN